jgi:hypothetical protein
MTRRARPAPKDLKQAGIQLYRAATREFEFTGIELELLHQLCVTIDEIAAMRADLREMGMVVSGSERQPRVNPLVAAIANHVKVADALVVSLALPIDGEAVGARRSAAAKAAADARRRNPVRKGRLAAVASMTMRQEA